MSMFLSLVRPIKYVSNKYQEIFIKTINKIVGHPALSTDFSENLKERNEPKMGGGRDKETRVD